MIIIRITAISQALILLPEHLITVSGIVNNDNEQISQIAHYLTGTAFAINISPEFREVASIHSVSVASMITNKKVARLLTPSPKKSRQTSPLQHWLSYVQPKISGIQDWGDA
jgi:hypothetical protein